MVTEGFRRSGKELENAQQIAIAALGSLAGDPERLSGFMALAGIDPAGLRQAAQGPAFLQGVLDYICADETLLREIAAAVSHTPESIDRARMILQGPQGDWGA